MVTNWRSAQAPHPTPTLCVGPHHHPSRQVGALPDLRRSGALPRPLRSARWAACVVLLLLRLVQRTRAVCAGCRVRPSVSILKGFGWLTLCGVCPLFCCCLGQLLRPKRAS